MEEEPEFVTLSGLKEPVKLMMQGDWMRGCPEGNEQSFLFSLYDYLNNDKCPCPQSCGYSIDRKRSDFFPLFVSCSCIMFSLSVRSCAPQPEFSSYIEHLRHIVKQSCPKCNIEFCFACGETINPGHSRPNSSIDAGLFHCSNLQGVILGVGLAMLETMFMEQRRQLGDEQSQGPSKAKSSKKRKMDLHLPPSVINGDEDEDETYYMSLPAGKKARGGTGYAGDGREDVSQIIH